MTTRIKQWIFIIVLPPATGCPVFCARFVYYRARVAQPVRAPACAFQLSIHHLWRWKMELIPRESVLLFTARLRCSEYLNSLRGSRHLPAGIWTYQTWQHMLYGNKALVHHKLTLSDFTAVLLQTLIIVKWNLSGLCLESVLNRLKWERQITWLGKDFSLNFGCVITQFWWAAVAQRSLRVGCLNLSSFLLPPCFAISVPLSPHANIIMDPLTRTIANLFSTAAGVVMTLLFARKL